MGACPPPPPSVAACPAAGRRRWQLLLPRELLGLELVVAAGCLVLGSGWTELPLQGGLGMHGGVLSALPPQLWPRSAFSECSLRSGLPL